MRTPNHKSTKRGRRGLRLVRIKAEELARDANAVSSVLDVAATKAKHNAATLDRLRDGFHTLLRMVRSYIDGRYTALPWRTLIAAVSAIIYFVNPFDLAPDFLPGLGLVDDASVIALTLAMLRRDLDRFVAWEAQSEEQLSNPDDTQA